jgi:hypothetical protein
MEVRTYRLVNGCQMKMMMSSLSLSSSLGSLSSLCKTQHTHRRKNRGDPHELQEQQCSTVL